MNSRVGVALPSSGRVSRVFVSAALVLLLVAAPSSVSAADGDGPTDAQWHSRHAIEDLAFRSGLGIPINTPDDFLTEVEGAPDGIVEATLLQAVFSSAVVPAGWETASHRSTVTPAAQGAMILATVAYALELAGEESEEAIGLGRIALIEAKALADFALVNLRRTDGRFDSIHWDGERIETMAQATVSGDASMLLALTTLEQALDGGGPRGDIYGDDSFRSWFAEGADALAAVVTELEPTTPEEQALVIRALSAHAAVDGDTTRRDSTEDRVAELARRFGGATPSDTVDLARASHALHTAAALLGDAGLGEAAADLDATLLGSIDPGAARVAGRDSLTVAEIAAVIEALTVIATTDDAARPALDAIIQGVILHSGMTPPSPGPVETLDPSDDGIIDSKPSTGTAPWVMAGEAAYADGAWTVTDVTIDVAGAMSVATALLTPPDQPEVVASDTGTQDPDRTPVGAADDAASSSNGAEPQIIVVESSEFALTPSEIELTAGAEVILRLSNAGLVLHNLEVADLGVFVEADPGSAAEVRFVVPEALTTASFQCNIPGHADAGMVGSISVVTPEPVAASDSSVADEPIAQPEPPIATPSAVIPPESAGNPHMKSALVLAGGFLLGSLVLIAGMFRLVARVEPPASTEQLVIDL